MTYFKLQPKQRPIQNQQTYSLHYFCQRQSGPVRTCKLLADDSYLHDYLHVYCALQAKLAGTSTGTHVHISHLHASLVQVQVLVPVLLVSEPDIRD